MGCGPSSRALDGARARGPPGRRPQLGGVSTGCEAGAREWRGRGKDFFLPNTGLRFTRRQMEKLDFKLTKLASSAYEGTEGSNGDWCDTMADEGVLALAESSTERLVQRLVCSVGMSDPRFASKFLIPLDAPEKRRHRKAGRSLRYLVRLDALSSPAIYPEEDDHGGCGSSSRPTCILLEGGGGEVTSEEGAGGRRMPCTPQGFARVRLQGEGVETWAEFIGQDGYLRSDRLQEHFVHLLSKAASLEASSTINSSSSPDSSTLCGSPGKILDPVTLHHTIKDLPPSHQIFFGPAELNLNRFPDPRDFHITIARSNPYAELLVTPLSPTILASKSFSSSLPDQEKDRTSVSMQVLLVLDSIVGALHTQRQRHFMFPHCNVVFLNSFPQQKMSAMRQSKRWAAKPRKPRPLPDPNLQNKVANFWQNAIILSGNLGSDDFTSSSEEEDADDEEEEFLTDASHVESALRCLHLISSPLGEPLEEDREGEGAEDYQRRIEVELALSKKWQGTLMSLVPTPVTDSNLSSGPVSPSSPTSVFSSQYLSSLPASAYSTRQLKYIQEAVRQVLRVKQITNQEQQNVTQSMGVLRSSGPVEELAYTLALLLDPSSMYLDGVSFCSARRSQTRIKWWQKKSSKVRDGHGMRRWKGNRNLFSIGKSKESEDGAMRRWSEVGNFPGKRLVVNKTMNAMIHDRDTLAADLSDDNTFVHYLLKWLIRAKKEEEKIMQTSRTHGYGIDENCVWNENSLTLKRWLTLGDKRNSGDGYMAQYLTLLYASSLENCIHLEEYLRHEEEKGQELFSFGLWSSLVEEGQIFPDEGVYDACSKGWKWAQSILDSDKAMSSSGLLQLVLAPKPGMSVRQSFNGPKSKDSYNYYLDQLNCGSSLTLPRTRAGATLPSRAQTAKAKEFLTLRLQRCQSQHAKPRTASKPLHCYLRESNPLSKIIGMSHRQGQYRGLGTPVSALIAMHKFSVLQEISVLLPEDEHQQVLDSIHRVSKVSRRRCRPQRRLGNVTGMGYGKYRVKACDSEKQPVDMNENEKMADGFGTVMGAIGTALGSGGKELLMDKNHADQNVDDIAERSEDGRGRLWYLCRVTMGQHQAKGTREIGLAHGVRNFAVLTRDPSTDKGVVATSPGDGGVDPRRSHRSRQSKSEMVTKL
ncbi:uncharacterized protein [Hetaerina americana]|uniref:uncharacterized protein n=1 Tax=Hetaerina americana TaxID=62018 RepID=UPI003A7F31FE